MESYIKMTVKIQINTIIFNNDNKLQCCLCTMAFAAQTNPNENLRENKAKKFQPKQNKKKSRKW